MSDQQKYDRQLRLWGEAAQKRLENTRVLTIGCDSVATEYLKSIILPGVGFVGIADDHLIDEIDIETNFFVEIDDIGKERGKITLNNLLELNDLVKGEYYKLSFDEILDQMKKGDKSFIDGFNIIVCSNQCHDKVVELSQYTKNVVIEVVTNGYIGFVKAYYSTHVIFDNGNPHIGMDLRIANPVPKLEEMYESLHMDELTPEQDMHLPFPFILIHCLKKWKETHNNKGPQTYAEQTEFKKFIKSQAISYSDEENYQQAVEYASYAWNNQNGNINEILTHENIEKIGNIENPIDREFWLFIAGVKRFNELHKRTPVDSTLKDMISGNEYYVQLQRAFTTQLEEDVKELKRIIEEILKEKGMKPEYCLDEETLKRHCKTLRKMEVFEGVKRVPEVSSWAGDEEDCLFEESEHPTIWYLVIMYGVFKFTSEFKRIPCDTQDVEMLKVKVQEVLKEKQCERELDIQMVEQMCRFGGVQIHSVNSVIGSFVSQEIIKFATHLFSGLHNTVLFNTETCRMVHGNY